MSMRAILMVPVAIVIFIASRSVKNGIPNGSPENPFQERQGIFALPGHLSPQLDRLWVFLGRLGAILGIQFTRFSLVLLFPLLQVWDFERTRAEFARCSKMQAPVSSSSAKAKMGLSNKRYMVITGM